MPGKVTVQDKGGELKLAIVIGSGGCRGMPELQASSYSDSEVTTRRGELECRDTAFEGEVVDDNSAEEVRQNRAAILVNGQKEVASGRKSKAVDIGAMREGKGIGGVAAGRTALVSVVWTIRNWQNR